MKKRVFSLLLALILLSLANPAYADVIYEPEDRFYQNNYQNCEYLGRSFFTNGKDGYVSIYRSPDSDAILDVASNGDRIYVSFTYDNDKTLWGVVQYTIDADGKLLNAYSGDATTGWIMMDELHLIYDASSFYDAHENKFYAYTGEGIKSGQDEIILWTFPCSGEIAGHMPEAESYLFQIAYKDQDGREWGHISYHFGMRNVWVCLSDPANKDIPPVEYETVSLTPPSASPAPSASLSSTTILLIVLIALLVIVTVVLIPVLLKRRKV